VIGWDYGNARVAALRCRLLDAAALRALGEAEPGDAFVGRLAAFEEWRPYLGAVPVATPRSAEIVDGAIDRHLSDRLSSLLRWYGTPERLLVEAVVMSVDLDRVLAVLRRRRAWGARAAAGMSGSAAAGRAAAGRAAAGRADADRAPAAAGDPTDGDAAWPPSARSGGPGDGPDPSRPMPGALLDTGCLARLTTATGEGGPFRELARLGLLDRREALALADAAEGGGPPGELEVSLRDAWDRARGARAVDAGDDGELVRAELAKECRDRDAVRDVLLGTGAADAAALERQLALERMERLARRARRQPLGIAPVLGYRAALEHQALLLRAMSARAGPDPRPDHATVIAGGA
jgi:ATP synthase (C/AC39) subunit